MTPIMLPVSQSLPPIFGFDRLHVKEFAQHQASCSDHTAGALLSLVILMLATCQTVTRKHLASADELRPCLEYGAWSCSQSADSAKP